MSGRARFLIRLYPAKWRERYGEELQALLEDSGSSSFAVFNLIAGALRMRLSVPSFPRLAVMLSVAGLAAGFLISFAFKPTYVSEAVMQMSPTFAAAQPGETILRLEKEVLSRTSLKRIIEDPRVELYPEERVHTPLEDVIESMRTRDIRIRIVSTPGQAAGAAFSIRFEYRDAKKARQTIQALLNAFSDANLSQARAAAKSLAYSDSRKTGMNLDVLDPPTLPVQATRPNRSIFAALGFAICFGIAVLIAIFRRKLPPLLHPAQNA